MKLVTPILCALALGLVACEAEPVADPVAPQTSGQAGPAIEERFPDYKPKLSPDTLMDYRPELAMSLADVPQTTSGLAAAFVQARAEAIATPGVMRPGAIQLGADEMQYSPSDAELMAAQLGALLDARLKDNPQDAAAVMKLLGDDLAYPTFTYRHVDVMGSGRFFYASQPRMRMLGEGMTD